MNIRHALASFMRKRDRQAFGRMPRGGGPRGAVLRGRRDRDNGFARSDGPLVERPDPSTLRVGSSLGMKGRDK